MPGHITGPGWNCINPTGNLDPLVFQKIGRGEGIVLPNMGMETVHHVHADDVAQVFMNAICCRGQALGESFHAVAPHAMTAAWICGSYVCMVWKTARYLIPSLERMV